MSEDAAPPVGPNLNEGIALGSLVEGEPFFGHVGDSPVFLLRRGEEVLAFNAVCTHCGAPLADGIFKNDTIRCPWHHASFSMTDGTVLGGPALNPLLRRKVSVDDDTVFDEYLESSQPGVYAAGDIASYPEPRLNRRVRIEHWVVAGRQGRTAARNILGLREPFEDVPFFWTEHYGTPLAYVGHAPEWDEVEKEGDCQGDGCAFSFKTKDKRTAFATVCRDKESLRVEAEMEED